MAKTPIIETDTPGGSPAHQAPAAQQPPVTNLTLLTIKEAAAKLRVHPQTVRRLLIERKLPGGFQLGGRRGGWRIVAAELDALINVGVARGAGLPFPDD